MGITRTLERLAAEIDRASTPKDRPILMSGPMVRATLADLKTQTRRVINPQPTDWTTLPDGYATNWPCVNKRGFAAAQDCPYGGVGGLLWVREKWQHHPEAGMTYGDVGIPSDAVCYAADLTAQEVSDSGRWRPSIHMPRWASRITLRITGVRVERVQDISEADARAEGFTVDDVIRAKLPSARDCYRYLWDELNAERGYGWDANPWVWVIEFERA